MEKPRTMMTTYAAGGRLLLAAILLGLPGANAEAYTGPLSPAIKVAIAQGGQSEQLACSVWQTTPPLGMTGLLVHIDVPRGSAVKTILLRTTAGKTPLEVTNELPLLGEYETIIDIEKTDCATSGTLVLDVEGGLETKTATCPGIVLPKGSGCND